MATHAPITGAPTRAPFIPAPPAAITRALSRFNRDQLAGFITVAIDLLDLADGDSESEEPGLEDSFVSHDADGPGCPIADGGADPAWIEWGTRGRHKQDRHGAELLARYAQGVTLHEDAEDDDPAEQDDESEDSDNDRCYAGDDHMIGGAVMQLDIWDRYEGRIRIGDDNDAEAATPPAYQIDQRVPLFVNAANDW